MHWWEKKVTPRPLKKNLQKTLINGKKGFGSTNKQKIVNYWKNCKYVNRKNVNIGSIAEITFEDFCSVSSIASFLLDYFWSFSFDQLNGLLSTCCQSSIDFWKCFHKMDDFLNVPNSCFHANIAPTSAWILRILFRQRWLHDAINPHPPIDNYA